MDEIKEKLEKCLKDGALVLVFEVWVGEHDGGSEGVQFQNFPAIITCHNIFSICGKLVGYFPVCGWLCVMKRRVTVITKGWDDRVIDIPLSMTEVIPPNDLA